MPKKPPQARYCLVDDDEWICDSLSALFGSRDLALTTFSDPVAFLEGWQTSSLRDLPAAIIVDIRMPRMSGLELFAEMQRIGLPAHNVVTFLTGHGDIEMAVDAIKSGAYDFVEKPFSDNAFVDRIVRAGAYAVARHEAQVEAEAAPTLDALTAREREIAERIVVGKTNGAIAQDLCISVRTVEVHRANLFRKLNIKTAVELVPLLLPGKP